MVVARNDSVAPKPAPPTDTWHIAEDHVEAHRVEQHRARGDNELLPVRLEHGQRGSLDAVVLLGQFTERRGGVLQFGPDVPSDQAHGRCEQERQPPAPLVELLRGKY